jgi:hypothetical protein
MLERKHSRAGIASFLIAVISIAGTAAALWIANDASAALSAGEGQPHAEEAARDLLSAIGLLFLFFTLSLVGSALGAAGIIQKNRLKRFSILGLVFNALLAFLFVAIMFIAALAGPALPITIN